MSEYTKQAHTPEQIESIFAGCETESDLRAANSNMQKHDPIFEAYFHRKKIYNRLKNARSKEIRAAELAPWEDQAKRLKHGDKVFFGVRFSSEALDTNFRFVPEWSRKIEAGEWCYVWHYQPRAKRLWLCRPGKKCEEANVFPQHFTVSDMMNFEISRTEIALRK